LGHAVLTGKWFFGNTDNHGLTLDLLIRESVVERRKTTREER